MINFSIVGGGQRIVWGATQAIRAVSLMSGVSATLNRMDTPDFETFAQRSAVICKRMRNCVGGKADA
ncbi:hypothetical protein [Dyella sp. 2HG41-7]|uniref:hypothetical protein n=1 Tax=Dyella sp. 2HG41-7 TaxID=2883239 RepID=UPI001F3A7039|nr:hypothetical protein [Dyella sp. 2HG41-7]